MFDDALLLGTAMHECIQKSVSDGLRAYFDGYSVLEDRNINEGIKLEEMGRKARGVFFSHCPDEGVIFEYKIDHEDFVGYIDALVPTGNENEYDVWDFKYSRKSHAYTDSAQVHLYKFFLEATTDYKVRNMYYLCMPKTSIRQKKTETLSQFRNRILEWCNDSEPVIVPVKYDITKVLAWYQGIKKIYETEDFPPNKTKLCMWCDFQQYCERGDVMNLPKNERRSSHEPATKRKVWLYGAPFSGKSTFCDSMPNALFINTDGNTNFLESPHVEVKDVVTAKGRIVERKLAWDVFAEIIEELEKKQNTFENIVIDLIDDVFNACRQSIYVERGIEHESDDSFKMWDIVRSRFYTMMHRFWNLDYKGLYIISHADMSKNLTLRSGEEFSKVEPSIQDKVASKLAGMVDVVGYVSVERGEHWLKFPEDDIHFGGGRLKGKVPKKIPLDYAKFCEIYPIADEPIQEQETKGSQPEPEQPNEEAKVAEEETVAEVTESEPEAEQPKPARRKRKVRTNE